MSYNIENLSLKALEKIYLVLDDIKFNMEIQNKTKYLEIGQGEDIESISENEYNKIMTTLLSYAYIVDKVHHEGGRDALDINVEKFNTFFKSVSDRINKLKIGKIAKKSSSDKKLAFDEVKSVLSVKGYEIEISMRDKKTVAHDILEYVFIDKKDNIADDFYYAEIAFDKFGDDNYKSNSIAWRKYHAACMDIQDKIRKQTAGKIDDFLIYNASQKGRVKINPKYLN